ncbi:MAG: flagellar basal body P-ring formation chaperone FlgA, partial [Acidobacteriota bacterium]
AVVAAVHLRMGDEVEVRVDAVSEISLPGGALTDAVAAPGAKLGAATRFVLRGPAAPPADPARLLPLGFAVVALRVVATHAHTARPVRRGAALDQGDLVPVRHVFTSVALKRLPSLDQAVHGRVLQDLAADACLTGPTFTAMPAVRAGADVIAIVRIGGIEARADLVSVDSGNPGDTVRVTNPQSRRTFRARVVARDLVEISHE